MKAKDLSSTALLGIAGALTIVAGLYILFMPAETLDAISRQIGLQDQRVGVEASETPDSQTAMPATRKRHSKREASSSSSSTEGFSVEAVTPAHAQPVIFPASVLNPAAEAKISAFKADDQHFIKATSMEQGHLLEKYMYVNGGVVLYVDGQLSAEHLAQDRRY